MLCYLLIWFCEPLRGNQGDVYGGERGYIRRRCKELLDCPPTTFVLLQLVSWGSLYHLDRRGNVRLDHIEIVFFQ